VQLICRYATHSLHFMDAYCKGLNDKQAVWVANTYHGHCMIPDSILPDLRKANIISK
ncbi:hypothetical protein L208DRAFT_1304036, partial [Tricholoma matsutake]